MISKPPRLSHRLDVRLYPKQRQKLDDFCKVNNISVGQLIRNFVESLKADNNGEQTLPKGLLGEKTAFETPKISRGDVL